MIKYQMPPKIDLLKKYVHFSLYINHLKPTDLIHTYTQGPDKLWASAKCTMPTFAIRHTRYENTPIEIFWTFNQKRKIFRLKNSDIFHIPAQNIDFGYSLEPPRRGGSNEYPQSVFLAK